MPATSVLMMVRSSSSWAFCNCGLRALQLGFDGKRGVGSGDALLHELKIGVVGCLGLIDRGLRLIDRELASALIERAERIAGLDCLALLDGDSLHDAGGLRHDADARLGLGAAAQRNFDRHVLGGHDLDAHRARRGGLAAARCLIAFGNGQLGIDVTFLLGMVVDARAVDGVGQGTAIRLDQRDDGPLAIARTLATGHENARGHPDREHEHDDQRNAV